MYLFDTRCDYFRKNFKFYSTERHILFNLHLGQYLASITEDASRNRIVCTTGGENPYLYELDTIERNQRNSYSVMVPNGTSQCISF